MSITDELKNDLRLAKVVESELLPTKVLIVDDNAEDVELLGNALRNIGCEVQIAMEGDSAINMVKASRPYSVMFLDLKFPVGKSGGEILRCIRKVTKDLSVVIITGSVTDDLISVAKEIKCSVLDKNKITESSLRRVMDILE